MAFYGKIPSFPIFRNFHQCDAIERYCSRCFGIRNNRSPDLGPGQVDNMKSCDRRRNFGRRDYAILLLPGRLGLRAGEVAHLCLEDIDWRDGELRLRRKRTRLNSLPLPQDVGQAIASYHGDRQSGGSSRRVFLMRECSMRRFCQSPNRWSYSQAGTESCPTLPSPSGSTSAPSFPVAPF